MDNKLGLSQKLKKINPMDDMFGINNSNEQIENIPVEMLIHYTEHKFKLYTGQRKQDLIESIREFGILTPIIVTPAANGNYMILAGHNRAECGKEAGLTEIPSRILKNISKEDAKQIVMITNLFQRSFSELAISEKAEIISDYYNLLKQKGGNITDIENEMQKFSELSPMGTEDKTNSVSPMGTRQVGQEYSLSKNSIARLLRINMLIDKLKTKIDENEISVRAAVNISYLTNENQEMVYNIAEKHKIKIDMKNSSQLKLLAKDMELSEEEIQSILMSNGKSNTEENFKPIKLEKKVIKKYFNNSQTQDEIQEIIEQALEKYFNEN